MTTNFAIVITGPRDFTDGKFVRAVLKEAHYRTYDMGYANFAVVHGECKTGVDHIAQGWAWSVPDVNDEPYPAPWSDGGKAAGPLRNKMIAVVADAKRFCGWDVECHAIAPSRSRGGTRDCIRALEAKQFKVTIHEPGCKCPAHGG